MQSRKLETPTPQVPLAGPPYPRVMGHKMGDGEGGGLGRLPPGGSRGRGWEVGPALLPDLVPALDPLRLLFTQQTLFGWDWDPACWDSSVL